MSSETDVYVAKTTFACDFGGVPVIIHRGVDRVRAGHELLSLYPEHFEPITLDVKYDIEQATAAPGEKRGTVGVSRRAQSEGEVSKDAQHVAAKQADEEKAGGQPFGGKPLAASVESTKADVVAEEKHVAAKKQRPTRSPA